MYLIKVFPLKSTKFKRKLLLLQFFIIPFYTVSELELLVFPYYLLLYIFIHSTKQMYSSPDPDPKLMIQQ